MRILFLTDSLSDLDGVGCYSVSLIQALEQRLPGLQVDVLLARKHRPTSKSVPAHWNVDVGLPPDYFFYMSPVRFWISLARAALKVAGRARGADLVHAIKDYPHNLVGLLGARLAARRCVATAHGTYSVQPLLDKRHARLARWTYKRLDAFISVSRYTRRRMLQVLGANALDPERLVVVPNAVSAEHYARRMEIGVRPWHRHPFTLGIGEVKERKGHHLSLAAFCRVASTRPDLHHYVVGHALGDAYHAELQRMIAEAGLQARVHFLGNVSEEEKIDLLQRTLVFVHTPVTARDGGFEGFGIVYLEAAACGVPVIGTLDCGAEDAIDDGVNGFLVAQELAPIERALTQLVDDSALRARMGAAGRERARRSSWADNARAVQALYERVLGRPIT